MDAAICAATVMLYPTQRIALHIPDTTEPAGILGHLYLCTLRIYNDYYLLGSNYLLFDCAGKGARDRAGCCSH